MKKYFAVMGAPISHSLSPVLFEHFAREHEVPLIYDKLQVEPESFSTAVATFFKKGGQGLNITAPLKEQAFELATEHSQSALFAKSANILYLGRDGKLWADNSDGFGLSEALASKLSLSGKRVLLLGSGGAARGVILDLLAKGCELTLAARDPNKLKCLEKEHPLINVSSFSQLSGDFQVVINATSASAKKQLPAIASELVNKALTLDMVYDRTQTVFQTWCLEHGASEALDGLEMLVFQASKSFEVFTGILPNANNALVFLKQSV